MAATQALGCVATADGGFRATYSVTLTGGQGWGYPGSHQQGGTMTFTLGVVANVGQPPPTGATVGAVEIYDLVNFAPKNLVFPPALVLHISCPG